MFEAIEGGRSRRPKVGGHEHGVSLIRKASDQLGTVKTTRKGRSPFQILNLDGLFPKIDGQNDDYMNIFTYNLIA